jgi:hypothetical protein
MTLTRATLGKLTKRATKDIDIDGNAVRIQRPTPLEFSQYQMSLVDKDGKWNATNLNDAILLLTARMWIDEDGARLFKDSETKELGSIDLGFYQRLSEECQRFSRVSEAPEMLGESVTTTVSDSPVESALSSE